MTKILKTVLLILMAGFVGCDYGSQTSTTSTNLISGGTVKGEALTIREPAVAGLFYPGTPSSLNELIDELLKNAPNFNISDLRAIISPHAGYVYSGPVAAYGYKQLIGKDYKTVIILAPSHYAWVKGASVCGSEVYRTPLGDVKISPKARDLAQKPPFVIESPTRVQRPGWSSESSRTIPSYGQDTPHTWEHSDEVQVPFLQKTLKDFELIPIIIGECNAEQAAKVLNEFIDEKTLIVASSDLSHYLPYESAKSVDSRCIKTICSMDLSRIENEEACGKLPIAILMHIAKIRGWKPQLLDYRNSGDTAGDKKAVVGYASIAFIEKLNDAKNNAQSKISSLTEAQRKFLLNLARNTIKAASRRESLPVVDENSLDEKLKAKTACFVTLTKDGNLRGCIGHISAIEPLYKAVIENAHAAAMYDTRFEPVKYNEVNDIEIEISILTEPKELNYNSIEDLLSKLRPGIDGVILNIGGRRSTFLPQVWEQLPDKIDFLNHLSLKAGCAPVDWRKPGTKVYIYQVEKFSESDF